MSVQPDQFPAFFEAVYGFKPFPWQRRLAERVTGLEPHETPWPRCIAAPTGSGKTACIDVAVFALACQAAVKPAQRTAPRRIVFVVDRRVVVDEAYHHAQEKLRDKLEKAEDGILMDVAAALRRVAGDPQAPPLTCHELRGGMYRDDAWALTPTQPSVICSTVDQYGSRLLFRGYGRSPNAWPHLAGLAGNDCLVILDEAHCAVPFSQTMRGVERYRDPQRWAEVPVGGPFHFVLMSATPPGDVPEDQVFRIGENDRTDKVLGPRLAGSKPTKLVAASKAKGARAQDELAVELIKQAVGLVGEERQAIAILVNRVYTAQVVYRILEGLRSGNAKPSDGIAPKDFQAVQKLFNKVGLSDFDAELLTGRMRPIDRDEVIGEWLGRLKSKLNGQRDLKRPVFIVATQCLEVGADLDFDGLVTECASLDALRQRFGRLNRTGRAIDARGVIVIRSDQTKGEDFVYGTKLATTWSWLNNHTSDGEADFGISAMDSLWNAESDEIRETLVLQGQNAPVMLPAHVDCWVQTAPEPVPTPDVSLFLHGPDQDRPEIQICWRADLPERTDDESEGEKIREAVALCPPTTLECLPVPLAAFRRWWRDRKEAKSITQDIADIEAAGPPEEDMQERSSSIALIWRGPEKSKLLSEDGKNLKPGDTVVLPVTADGWNVFGHVPGGSEQTIDVGDISHFCHRRQAVLRLHPNLLTSFAKCEGYDRLLEILQQPEEPGNEFEWSEVEPLLAQLAGQNVDQASERLGELLRQFKDQRRRKPHPFGGFVLIGPKPKPSASWWIETQSIEDDSASEEAQSGLHEHCKKVAEQVVASGRECDMPKSVAEILRLAACLHDLGKADGRFQSWLHGGNRWLACGGELLAKSVISRTRAERDRDRRRAGVPRGFRHELVSVRLIESRPDLTHAVSDPELLLHLVGSHHGHCHPFAPVIDDDGIPVTVDYEGQSLETCSATGMERVDSGVAERFWRLVRRYGWWGLAYLEAILILADHRTSELEQEKTERARTETPRPAMSRR